MIAEFEGYKVVTTKFGTLIIWLKNGSTTRLDSWAKYHVDWNALMLVVIKCHDIGKEMEKKYFAKDSDLDDPSGWRAWNFRRVSLSTSIETTYRSVVAFIQFYNSTKTATDE